MSDSYDDAASDVAAAVAGLQDGAPVPDEPSVPLDAEPEEVAEIQQSRQRSRDEFGRFSRETDKRRSESLSPPSPEDAQRDVKRSIDALQGKPVEPEAPAAVDYSQPPNRWNREARAMYSQLPPAVQRAVRDQLDADTRNMEHGVNVLKQRHAEQLHGFEQAFAPLRNSYAQYGYRSDAEALQALSAAQQMLASDPAGSIIHMIRNAGPQVQQQIAQAFGIGGNGYAPQQHYQQPDIRGAIREEIGLANAVSEIEQFSAGKPYFGEIKDAMASLLSNGAAHSLQQAHDMVCFGLPHLRQYAERQQPGPSIQAKRRAAASSLNGAPHGAAPPMKNGAIRGRNHFEDASADVREAINQLR